jgi:hypothetical protein
MIIGLVGFIGSGKGTVANILATEYGFKKLSFADALKDAVSVVFHWPRELLEGETDESRAFREQPDEFWSKRFGYSVTPRYMLQLMGTEAGRGVFNENIWIYSIERQIQQDKNYVISDVRFPNEASFVSDNHGFTVRVQRGNDPEWFETAREQNVSTFRHKSNNEVVVVNTMKEKYPSIHYSEWAWIGLTKVDYILNNVGTIDELKGDINHMLKVFTGPSIL